MYLLSILTHLSLFVCAPISSSLCVQFARQLVRLAFPKVCVLDGGAGVLRTLGLLTSLNNDP